MFKLSLAFALFVSSVGSTTAFSQDSKVDSKPLDGASSLSETHGDWVINCEVVKDTKQCRMSQQQFSAENNNQRLIAIEFLPEKDSVLNGTIAMPFGLDLAKAVTLAVDDDTTLESAPFSTCYVVGCVVPLRLQASTADRFKTGTLLMLQATAVDTQQPIKFTVSLKGFASALKKLQKLDAR
jgi:invasion protein IalB